MQIANYLICCKTTTARNTAERSSWKNVETPDDDTWDDLWPPPRYRIPHLHKCKHGL